MFLDRIEVDILAYEGDSRVWFEGNYQMTRPTAARVPRADQPYRIQHGPLVRA
jgi:hypothetical protein